MISRELVKEWRDLSEKVKELEKPIVTLEPA